MVKLSYLTLMNRPIFVQIAVLVFDFVESENAHALAPHVIDVVTINQAIRNRSGVVIDINNYETKPVLKVVRARPRRRQISGQPGR
jgi:predicted anti-sigma-YlaC factor YlaD